MTVASSLGVLAALASPMVGFHAEHGVDLAGAPMLDLVDRLGDLSASLREVDGEILGADVTCRIGDDRIRMELGPRGQAVESEREQVPVSAGED